MASGRASRRHEQRSTPDASRPRKHRVCIRFWTLSDGRNARRRTKAASPLNGSPVASRIARRASPVFATARKFRMYAFELRSASRTTRQTSTKSGGPQRRVWIETASGTRSQSSSRGRTQALADAASLTIDEPLRDVPHPAPGRIARVHPLHEVPTKAAQIGNWFNVNGALSAGYGPGDTRKPFGEFSIE